MSALDPEVVSRHPAAQWRPNRERLLAALETSEGEKLPEEELSDDDEEDGSAQGAQPLPWSPHAPVAQSDRATAS